ncbi:hypothetical protein AB838_13875 [Rhodobacteraceae bacterium (ex Bugula neritina AB1)]|nr:hypothetical protein AB838_13875 [Rhodobacteraceae bacterium (ex Bugula neritina AB1)]
MGNHLPEQTYLVTSGTSWANATVSLQMLFGAALPILVPLQLAFGLSGTLSALALAVGAVSAARNPSAP